MSDEPFERFLRDLARIPTVGLAEAFTGTERFELRRPLGEGGFGAVYEVWDHRDQERRALKVLKAAHPEWLYRFKREFRLLQGIRHRNLVRLHELHTDGEHWFFTMELVEGRDLLAAVGDSPDRLRSALGQLAAGLVALHEAGRVHRDIKPSNVIVTPTDRVVVLDFGLATDLQGDGSTTLGGTPLYMAPEQCRAEPITTAADWYAVGVLLYEALTGRPPFPGGALQLLATEPTATPAAPVSLNPAAPAELSDLSLALLSRDPGSRPDGAAVLARVRAATPEPAARPLPRELFVGRAGELDRLERAVAEAADGRAGAVFISGESGVGKSALLGRLLGRVRASQPRALVLTGQCYEQERLPFKVFDPLIDALSRVLRHLPGTRAESLLPREAWALAVLFPVLGQVAAIRGRSSRKAAGSRAEVRSLGFQALRDLLGRLAEQGPLVLAVDDLHWGDADSAVLLGELLRPPRPPAILFLGAQRPLEAQASPFFRAWNRLSPNLLPTGAAHTLTLQPLDPAEATDLATELLAAVGGSARLAAAIAREAGGNPFFINELARQGEDRPRSLADLVAHRVGRQDEATRQLLEVVAVADQPLEVGRLRRVAEGPDLAPRLERLLGENLIRTSRREPHEAVTVFHGRIREAVLSGLPPERRTDIHRRLAEALTAEPAREPERIAFHFREAGLAAPARGYLVVAADLARDACAHAHAAALYQEALALDPGQGRSASDERALRRKLAEMLALAGRPVEAADAYLRLARDSAGLDAVRFRCRAGEELLQAGHLERGERTLASALAILDVSLPAHPARALLRLLPARARLRLRGYDAKERPAAPLPEKTLLRLDTIYQVSASVMAVYPATAAALRSEYALQALEAGDPGHLVRALGSEAALLVSMRHDEKRRRSHDLLARARQIADRIGTPEAEADIGFWSCLVAFFEGRFQAAREAFRETHAFMQRHGVGSTLERTVADLLYCNCLFWQGRAGEMGAETARLRPYFLERGNLLATLWVSLYASWAALAAGHLVEANGLARDAFQLWRGEELQLQSWWRAIQEITFGLYRGDGRAAFKAVDAAWPRLRLSLILSGQYHRIEARWFRARAALAAAAEPSTDRARLIGVARRETGKIEKEWTDLGEALVLGLRADLAALERGSDREKLASLLDQAVERFTTLGLEAQAAVARRLLGRLVGGDRGRDLGQHADQWLAEQEIADPDAWSRIYLPAVARLLVG